MIFPQLNSTVKIPISLGTLARDMPSHRPSSSWKQETTVRSDVFDKHSVTSRPEAHAAPQHVAGTKDMEMTSVGLAGEYLTDVGSMVHNIQVSAEVSTII